MKKVETMHRGFAGLPIWAYAFALSKEVFTKLNALFTFSKKSLLLLSRFIQSSFPGEEALCTEENWTLWKSIASTDVAIVAKRSIDEGIAWYMSLTRLLLDYLEEDGAHAWAAKRKVLLEVRLGHIAASLRLDGAYNNKL